ncbi:Uncharacterised protein [uncultured archaeon]|nr:Uncharacterised protein [uncultured archaeon]
MHTQRTGEGGVPLPPPSPWVGIPAIPEDERDALKTPSAALAFISDGIKDLNPRRFLIREKPFILGPGEPREPTVRRGYSQAVKDLDTTLQPTLNLANFIELEVSKPIAQLLNGGVPLELHRGSPDDCMASLSQRGYTRFYAVKTPIGPPLFLAASRDKYVFAMAGLFGDDVVLHYEALAKYLQVRPTDLDVFDYGRDYRALVEGSLERHSVEPDAFIIGGWTGGKILEVREQLRRTFSQITDHWKTFVHEGEEDMPLNRVILRRLREPLDGPPGETKKDRNVRGHYGDVYDELHDFLASQETDRLFTTPVGDIIKDGRLCQRAYDLWEKLKGLGNHNTNVPELPQVREIKHPGGSKMSVRALPLDSTKVLETLTANPLSIGVLKYRDSHGDVRTLAVSSYPYGDMSRYVTDAIIPLHSLKTLLFVGTAGSILGGDDPRDKILVGDIGVPMNVFSDTGRLLNPTVENGFLEYLEGDIKADAGISEPAVLPRSDSRRERFIATSHVNVETPFFETKPHVEAWRRGYFDSVDVEVGEIFQALESSRGRRPAFGALLYMSDVLGAPGSTLGEVERTALSPSRSTILDVIVRYLDVQEILPWNEPITLQ